MTIESDADLDGMFSLDDWAVTATYTPDGGQGVQVALIVTRGDRVQDQGEYSLNAPARIAYLRRADLAAPKTGDTLAVNGETLRVMQARLDELGVLWTLDLAIL